MRLIQPFPKVRKNVPPYPSPDDVYITQSYGQNGLDYSQFGLKFHNGIDYRAKRGTPALAVHSGYVIESVTKDTGYGLRVSIAWEGEGVTWVAIYGHFEKSAFPEIVWDINRKTYPIKQGDVVGYVDSTGFSTGDHLHLGLYQYKDGVKLHTNNGGGGAIDPKPFIKENYMEFYQVQNEKTIVMKNLDGKFIQLASSPEFYPAVAKLFGLEGKILDIVSREEVNANLVGEANAGIAFIPK